MRPYLILAVLVIIASALMIQTHPDPDYADEFYYYNAAASLADGDGLQDDYLWVYINAPDSLPAESHRYWMPLASLVAFLPMMLFGTAYNIAQTAFVPIWIGYTWIGFWLGKRVAGKTRHAWVAGLSMLFGGLYLPFWLATDNFILFGVVGAGAILALGRACETQDLRWYALAGVCAGLGHLSRADGLLLLIVGLVVIGWRRPAKLVARPALTASAVLVTMYFLVMLPWFARNIAVLGAPLPSGGLGTAFLLEYNDLFSYPADYPVDAFLDLGPGGILESRVDGTLATFYNWLAVENLIILAPFAAVALWQRRQERFWAPMIWYAVALHTAMALVFTYPGMRGSLFHSSAALYPFWVALGLAGLDLGIAWVGRWRKWRIWEAQTVFGSLAVLLPMFLGGYAWVEQQESRLGPDYYTDIDGYLSPGARIMVNDPAGWHYHTQRMGVTLPDEPLETALEIAERYCVAYLVIDTNVTSAFAPLIKGEEAPPAFLIPVEHLDADTLDDWRDDVRIYRFAVDCTP